MAADPQSNNSPAARIFIIDGDAAVAGAEKLVLMRAGFEVHVTQDGRDGLLSARSVRPDLLVLDLVTANLNGIEILQLLRANEDLGYFPILLTSSFENRSGVLTTIASVCGAHGFLQKPCSDEELIAKVKWILRNWLAVLEDQIRRGKSATE